MRTFVLPPERALALRKRGIRVAVVSALVGLALQAPLPLFELPGLVYCNLLGLVALAIAGSAVVQLRRQSPEGFTVELGVDGLRAQWAGQPAQFLPWGSIQGVETRRDFAYVRAGARGILLPPGLDNLAELRRAILRAKDGEPMGEAPKLRPPKSKGPPPPPPMRPWVQRGSDIGAMGGLVSLLATVLGGWWVGFGLGLPALGAFLVFLSLWIGTERGVAVLDRGVVTLNVAGGLAPVELRGGRARFHGWINICLAVVLSVLGGIFVVVGVYGLFRG